MVGTDEDDAYLFVLLNNYRRICDFTKHRENQFYWCDSPSSLKKSNLLFSVNREICEICENLTKTDKTAFSLVWKKINVPCSLLLTFSKFSKMTMDDLPSPHRPHSYRIESLHAITSLCSRVFSGEITRDSFLDPVNSPGDQVFEKVWKGL